MRSRYGRRWPVAEEKAGDSRDTSRRVVKDMSISHAEFFRTVRPLLEGETCELREDGVILRRGGASIEIRLGPEGRRRLGQFGLPRTVVEIVFDGVTGNEADRFLAGFDTRFRRGGG